MATALYRRYRPESFAELIGQSQVTDPLITALKTNRVNHAYLFSGPRGCGKTTSARILARCLNCEQGPTPEPCGKCPSCIELARSGSGSLDVVEIDAASHNGVDDARDLRERAGFAPARDRYKIFILDEAHMVTTQGFNALLKIVEEPPAHVKFIFATTEPDKVISTIRSRTHHYPFRLAPPNVMLDYLNELLSKENLTADPGVLSLVTRAGGGSFRDTLSVLDQLIAGSEGSNIDYDLTVALLGYTHASLLEEVTTALADQDSAGVFKSVDKVIQTGQDPKRFAEDLLERFRDLILVSATKGDAASVLRGTDETELLALETIATKFGQTSLSKAADIIADAITELSGATSPKLQLEILMARLLVALDGGSLQSAVSEPSASVAPATFAPTPGFTAPVPKKSEEKPAETKPNEKKPDAPKDLKDPASVSIEHFQNSWEQILQSVSNRSKATWTVLIGSTPRIWEEGVLHIAFASESNLRRFAPKPGEVSAPDHLRAAIAEVLSVATKFLPYRGGSVPQTASETPVVEPTPKASKPDTPVAESASEAPAAKVSAPEAPVAKKRSPEPNDGPRYGDAVLREVLNAKPVEKDK
ncbi:MAG: DNA polymerase III subunit gamma and tau [Microbacteriaceae bacterium]|nr:DNA polymerase III subunit gamma and tau [Microbacteriaceae bacterium]